MKTLTEAVTAAVTRRNRRAEVELYQAAHQQPIYTLRRTNMQALAEVHGASNLSVMLGYRHPSFLSQLLGNGWNRVISEKNARDYEKSLSLPEGTLDKPLFGTVAALPVATASNPAATAQVSAPVVPAGADDVGSASLALLAAAIEALNRNVKDQEADINTLQFGKLLSVIVLDAADHGGKVRESHVRQMLELIK